MAGRLTLDQKIGVRVPVPQPIGVSNQRLMSLSPKTTLPFILSWLGIQPFENVQKLAIKAVFPFLVLKLQFSRIYPIHLPNYY